MIHDHFMHFCGKFWDTSIFWPSTTRITSKLSLKNLNSLVHLATVEYEWAVPPSVFWKSAWISFAFISFFIKYLITAQISVLSIFTNQNAENNRELSVLLSCRKCTDVLHVHSQMMRDYCVGNLIALALTSRVIPRSFPTTLVKREDRIMCLINTEQCFLQSPLQHWWQILFPCPCHGHWAMHSNYRRWGRVKQVSSTSKLDHIGMPAQMQPHL